jgi:predicted nucleotide-binding protein
MDTITFLIAQRTKQSDFFDTFDGAVNFKKDANVVVLEDTNALRLVLEKFTDATEFRLLIHANIGVNGQEVQTHKLQTVVGEIRAIISNDSYQPFFITRSAEIKTSCINQKKCFVALKDSDIMCSHTSKLSDKNFLTELKPLSKVKSDNPLNKSADKPKIFIGSSSRDKALSIAQSIKNNLFNDKDTNGNSKYTLHIWNEDLFKQNKANIENLENILNNHDYGIFVFNGDDEVYNREINGTDQEIPRDNVIFEYGMFMGKYTRAKVFFVIPRPKGNLKIMSDLLGITALEYDTNDDEQVASVGVACNKIREELKKF